MNATFAMRAAHQSLYSTPLEGVREWMMRCWAQYLLWAVIAILGTGSLLSACGQKGPLYLPDKTERSKDERKK